MIRRIIYYKWYFLTIIVMTIAIPLISSYLTLLLQKIYNEVTSGTPEIRIFQLVLQGVLIWLINRLLFFTQSLVKSKLICNIKQDLKHVIFVNALELQTTNLFQIGSSGEYISIFNNDINIMEQRFFSVLIDLISQICSIVIFFGAFFSMNHKLAVFVAVFGIAVMCVPVTFAKKLNNTSLDYSYKISTFTQSLKEYFQSFATIKNYAVEDMILRKFDIENRNTENSKFQYDTLLAIADGVGSLLTWFARMVVIGAGLIMVSHGEILLGTVVAAQTFSVQLATPLQLIVQDINSIKSIKSIIDKIDQLTVDIDSEEVHLYNDSFNIFDKKELNIEFVNLSINANQRKVLDNFSFFFEDGKKYLIIGKNGAGKSSVFKALIKRFREYEGVIKINDQDICNLSNEQLSQMISYLGENVSLFTGSVKDNITFWQNVPEKILNYAIEEAHLNISLDRLVGDEGFNISSGEQRRIEIARGLIKPTRVMIFDEIVSTLDIETAYDIEKTALSYQDKTIIFISHNFSGKLIREYDDILVMQDGKLLAHGSYEELLGNCEYFRQICEIKFGCVD